MKKLLMASAAAAMALSGVAGAQDDEESLTIVGSVPLISSISIVSEDVFLPSLGGSTNDLTAFTTQNNSGNGYTVTVSPTAGATGVPFVLANADSSIEIPFEIEIDAIDTGGSGNPDDECDDIVNDSITVAPQDDGFDFFVDSIDPCAYDLDIIVGDNPNGGQNLPAGDYLATVFITLDG